MDLPDGRVERRRKRGTGRARGRPPKSRVVGRRGSLRTNQRAAVKDTSVTEVVIEEEHEGHRDPAFTADFVNYFRDREIEISNDTARLHALGDELAMMRGQEQLLIDDVEEFDRVRREAKALLLCNEQAFKRIAAITNISSSKLLRACDSPVSSLPSPSPTTTSLINSISSCGYCNDRRGQDSLLTCRKCNRGRFHTYCISPAFDLNGCPLCSGQTAGQAESTIRMIDGVNCKVTRDKLPLRGARATKGGRRTKRRHLS